MLALLRCLAGLPSLADDEGVGRPGGSVFAPLR